MYKITVALAAAFAVVAQAWPEQNGTYSMPKPTGTGATGTAPTGTGLTGTGLTGTGSPSSIYSSSSASGGFSSSSAAAVPTSSGVMGTGSPSSIYSSSGASGGISSSSNGSTPITETSYVTTQQYTTVTSFPVTNTYGSGASATAQVTTIVSTIVKTSTITVCTKCVSPQTTASGAGSPSSQGPASAPFPTGGPSSAPAGTAPIGTGSVGNGGAGSPDSSVVLTYTLGTGASATVVTTTLKNTKTATNYQVSKNQLSAIDMKLTNHQTVYVSPTQQGGASQTSGAAGSPETGITGTSAQTKTSTRYVYATPSAAGNGAQGSTCPAQVTVTVPAPDVTVTVVCAPRSNLF
ncbi:MAG: hypothetical protein OHK93_006467 [Ramalina farinacea]|uniref:Uncharacterized protein n=1 Tax=Ramalina farinacea TaxID=258253 RepID=A0AA43QIL3_9LECA|nr:hypothetical protein [Ramalina farinacea]